MEAPRGKDQEPEGVVGGDSSSILRGPVRQSVDDGSPRHSLFPDELPSVRTTTDTDNPRETPYTCYNDGTPLYKGEFHTFQSAHATAQDPTKALLGGARSNRTSPPGFIPNKGADFVDFFITTPDGITQQAAYVKVIFGIMPIVMGIVNDSDKVFTKPLYADPVWPFTRRPIYTPEELVTLEHGYVGRADLDRCVETLRDKSLEAEIHRYRMLREETVQLNTRIRELEAVWGTMDAARLGCVRRLEMADTLARIEDVREHTLGAILGGAQSYALAVRRGLRT